MTASEPPDAEDAILRILQKYRKDFMTVPQILRAMPAAVRTPLGLRVSDTRGALARLQPSLGEKTRLYQRPRSTFIGRTAPPADLVLNAVRAKSKLSPRQLARKLPLGKSDFVHALNQLLEDGRVVCTFKDNPDCTPVLIPSGKALVSDDRASFQAAIDAVGEGQRFVRIHRLREHLGWSRARFDGVLHAVASDHRVQLHGGDPSAMSEREIRDSYVDENNILYIGVSLGRE